MQKQLKVKENNMEEPILMRQSLQQKFNKDAHLKLHS